MLIKIHLNSNVLVEINLLYSLPRQVYPKDHWVILSSLFLWLWLNQKWLLSVSACVGTSHVRQWLLFLPFHFREKKINSVNSFLIILLDTGRVESINPGHFGQGKIPSSCPVPRHYFLNMKFYLLSSSTQAPAKLTPAGYSLFSPPPFFCCDIFS